MKSLRLPGPRSPVTLQSCLLNDLLQQRPTQVNKEEVLRRSKLEGGASQAVLVIKSPPASAGDVRDTGSIPGSERSPGGGLGNPLQYSCLQNPVDRGAWWAAVHVITESGRTEAAWQACTQSGGYLQRYWVRESRESHRGCCRDLGSLRVAAAPELNRTRTDGLARESHTEKHPDSRLVRDTISLKRLHTEGVADKHPNLTFFLPPSLTRTPTGQTHPRAGGQTVLSIILESGE